jgi:hypothetical protein
MSTKASLATLSFVWQSDKSGLKTKIAKAAVFFMQWECTCKIATIFESRKFILARKVPV